MSDRFHFLTHSNYFIKQVKFMAVNFHLLVPAGFAGGWFFWGGKGYIIQLKKEQKENRK